MIYLIAGHNGPGTGAMGLNGANEGAMTIELRDDIYEKLCLAGVVVSVDDERHSLRKVLSWLGSSVNSEDIVVDIHFNAFSSSTAHGTEVIIPNQSNQQERDLAKDLCDAICGALNTRNRGVKPESRTARKRIGILSGAPRGAVNVLLEICFITNEHDLKSYNENYGRVLSSIVNVLERYAQ